MDNSQLQNTNLGKVPVFGEPYERRIGDTKFIITAFDNKNTTDTVEDLIGKLIERTVANP